MKCENGQLIITPDVNKAQEQETKTAFMDEEIKKPKIRMKRKKLLQNMWQSRVHAVMERKHERGREYGKDYYVRII